MQEINPESRTYATDLSAMQVVLVKACLDKHLSRLRKYKAIEILNAIVYVVKSGCQWSMVPKEIPGWKTAYHHFRSLSERGWFMSFLSTLVGAKRASMGHSPEPDTCIMDSQSVRSALPHSEKGVDGNKRIKGIKRQVAVDSNVPIPPHISGIRTVLNKITSSAASFR